VNNFANSYTARSATRVDLAGGTLDLWPLHSFVGQCATINVSVSVFTYCDLEKRKDKKITIESKDQEFKKEFDSIEELYLSKDPALNFFKCHIKYWNPSFGFNLTTRSESPIGGGLGGSSSLSISVMKTFAEAINRKFDLYSMVEAAHNIEAEILRTPTGIQDYVAAISPGLNIIEFSHDGFKVSNSKFPEAVFNENAILVYTGKPHNSGINNFEVCKLAVEGKQTTLIALKKIRDVTLDLRSVLLDQDYEKLSDIFRREYQARVELTPLFLSPEIEILEKLALMSGAEAIKICGAGGGGCVMVWAPEKKKEVSARLKEQGMKVLDVSIYNG